MVRHPAFPVQFKNILISPYIDAVRADIKRQVTDDADTLLMCVITQFSPLPEKKILLEPIII